MTTQNSTNTTNFRSTDQFQKSFGAITYDEGSFQKAGTLLVGYGPTQISFATVTDFLIFVNQIIVPLTNKTLSATGDLITPMTPGAPGTDPITD
jgi:hypothetical protein